MTLPTPHGFGDDERSRRLRRRPPADALAWVERSLGVRVRSVRAYKGGSSSAIHGLRVEGTRGAVRTVVLRYVLEHLNTEEPDPAEREARGLGLLEARTLPTTELLGVDPTGGAAGVPAVVMSRLAGRLDWSPTELEPWLVGLVDVLPPIHGAPIRDGVPGFFPCRPDSWDVPRWSMRACGTGRSTCSTGRGSTPIASSSTVTTTRATWCGSEGG